MSPLGHIPLCQPFSPIPSTLLDVLLVRAKEHPHQVAYHFLPDPSEPFTELTYGDLFKLATGLAAILQKQALGHERILLLFKSNALFIIAFFACLLAGSIAVPTPIPRREQLASRLQAIIDNSNAKAAISDSIPLLQNSAHMSSHDLLFFDIASLIKDHTLLSHHAEWQPPSISSDTLAFIQYTSGSTGTPKGVMITHNNLIANSAIIYQAFHHSPQSRGLIALPLFHDMGLIGGVIQPLYGGFPVYFMTTTQFIQQPHQWLQIISDKKITTSGGPNFVYDLCTQVSDELLSHLDLSSWSVAFCGAEPIRQHTIEAFSQRFIPYRFKREAFYPCYGMAETTLFVTGKEFGTCSSFDQSKHSNYPLISCGHPFLKTEVIVVDPSTREKLSEKEVGEIWVRGTSVAKGYWQNTTATTETFHATLAEKNDYPNMRSYLRTGDLGYFKDGALYICSRLKDLIIIDGKNFSPQDLELTAENSHIGLHSSGGAAFTISHDGRERLILACEVKRSYRRSQTEWPNIKNAIRAAISNHYAIRVTDVLLLFPGSLPRTSSGKVRRKQCQTDYLSHKLQQLV